MPQRFSVAVDSGPVSALEYRAADAPTATLVLAHGAGAGQTSPFMVQFATGLAARGLDVVTFNFPYMDQRRRAPDPGATLERCYLAVIRAVDGRQRSVERGCNWLFIGGKSMGGRIATHIAAREADGALAALGGIVLLGYPLHPPGRPRQLRDKHLAAVRAPMLFVQGSRDAFGTPEELTPILDRLTALATLHVVEGGDHSLTIAAKHGVAPRETFDHVQDAIAGWIRGRARG